MIPSYEAILLPLLEALSDGKPHSPAEVCTAVAERLHLSTQEVEELLPSGRSTRFSKRVHWARFYLAKAGLISTKARGIWQITEEGRALLLTHPQQITVIDLEKYSSFDELEERAEEQDQSSATRAIPKSQGEIAAPAETLEDAYQKLRSELIGDLLDRILSCTPAFFEKLVLEVLLRIGYGGSRRDAMEAIGRTGDGGIDGVIKEDRLGLDTVCIQAKRWKDTVGRPVVQGFVGSLDGRGANKGILITTSKFSADAVEYITHITKRVVLIDGQQLANLMIDNEVGVTGVVSYEVKRIDSDFFTEDE